MTKRNLVKKLASSAVASAMVLGTSAVAFAAPSALAVDGAVINPIISVEVPATLKYTVDPHELGGTGQIRSGEFAFLNKSDVAVNLSVAVGLKTAANLTANEDEIKPTDPSVTAKKMYLAIDVPKTVKDSQVDNDTSVTPNNIKWKDAQAYGDYTASEKFGVSGKKFVFSLDSGKVTRDTDGNTTKIEKESKGAKVGAAFKLTGSLNSYAAWGTSDIAATITYEVNPVKASVYTANIFNANAANLLIADGFQVAKEDMTKGTDLTTGFNTAKEITTVKAGSVTLAESTDYTLVDNTTTAGTITFNATSTNGAKVFTTKSGNAAVVKVIVTFADKTTSTLEVTVSE